MYSIIGVDRLSRAKRAFSTRTVPAHKLRAIHSGDFTPRAGDIVLARVLSVGHHGSVELTTSRKATLFAGDEIIVAYGNRYAPDQFEAEVPDDSGPCALAAGGGIAARILAQHDKMRPATVIAPIGVFCDDQGKTINVADHALPDRAPARKLPGIAVAGGSMNAGKTTTCARLIRGLTMAGLRVGAAKITGTGAGNDYWHMYDAGAHAILDFTDAGMATTYKAEPSELRRVANTLAAELTDRGCEILVFEIADGVFQPETAWLVGSDAIDHLADAYLYAAESSASAVMGVQWLRAHNKAILGISGLASASPLASREAESATGLPMYSRDALATREVGLFMAQAVSATQRSAAA